MELPPLSLLQSRVLGVLVEKQHTVPDTYPLTLNALTAGCNQKTSRDPLLDASGVEVQDVVDELRSLSLLLETSGGRVMRYAHNMERALGVPSQAVAILATLMLRGAQTIGELRLNCERLHRFADTSALEAFLTELSARPAGALVTELRRQPGARENRWVHLLSGPPALAGGPPGAAGGASAAAREGPENEPDRAARELGELKATVDRLQDELEALKLAVAGLRDRA